MERWGEALNTATRPLVTIILVGVLSWGFLFGREANGESMISGEVFSTIVAGVIGYWFAKRDVTHEQAEVATAAAEQVVANTVERRGTAHEHEAAVERRAIPAPASALAARRREP